MVTGIHFGTGAMGVRFDIATAETAKGSDRSFELKLSGAQDHLQEIKGAVEKWIAAGHQAVTQEPDPQRADRYNVWIDAPDLPSDALALLVGDCLHRYRTALDHLAFELATTFTPGLSEKDAESSQFPIFGDVDRKGNAGTGSSRFHRSSNSDSPNRGSGQYQIQFMDPKAQEEIERLQPYHRG